MDKKDQIRYQNDFIKEKYDKMTVAFPKGKKEEYRERAKEFGISLNALINKLLFEFFLKKDMEEEERNKVLLDEEK